MFVLINQIFETPLYLTLLSTYSSPRRRLLMGLVYGLHLLVLFLLYRQFGINSLNEGDKYLSTASALTLQNARQVMEWQWLYSTYIFFLAFCLKLGLGIYGTLLLQYLLSLYAYYRFYRCLQQLLSPGGNMIATALLLLSPLIAYWQLNFYSESLYTALALVFTSLVFHPKKNYWSLALCGVLLFFCRPSAIFFLLGGAYVLLQNTAWMPYRRAGLAACLTALFLLILFVWPLHPAGIALPVAQGHIICGFARYPEIQLNSHHYTLFQAYELLAAHHGWGTVIQLFFQKLLSFFTLTRPYFSPLHNGINALHYVFYLGPLLLLLRKRRPSVFSGFAFYAGIAIAGHALLTGLFFNEWHERYIVPLFPFFIVLTVFSFYRKPSHAV